MTDATADAPPRNRVALRDAVLALPHAFALLARLVSDPRVDRRRRLVALGALAYAASPVDLIPEAIPVVGKADDALVVILAIRMLLDGADEELLAEHWAGPPETLEAFDDVAAWAAGLVPRRLRWAFTRLVAR
jgi:uncharacterized membrane protein YkvA (DUF1232 family)